MAGTGGKLVAALCGVLFSLGWWACIDGIAYGNKLAVENDQISMLFVFLPLGSTLAILLLNTISSKNIVHDDSPFGESSPMQRVLLFVYLGLLLLCPAITIWLVSQYYLQSSMGVEQKLPAMMQMFSTGLLTVCGLLFKFGRIHEDDSFF